MTDATHADTTDATLTEYVPAAENADPSITGAAAIDYVKVGHSWQTDDGESLHEVGEYRAECECGKTFANWGAATAHAEEEH